MAKMRGIKPETWTDDKVLQLSPLARWLFVGLWTIACDNGHVEDSTVQIKVRLLPVDDCSVTDLLDELIATKQVVRGDGFLKVVNLTEHQNIDKRYLRLCEWCKSDPETAFTEADRPSRPSRAHRAPTVPTPEAHRAPTVPTQGALGGHDVEGEGEGEGEEKGVQGGEPPSDPQPRKRGPSGTRIPEDFAVTDDLRRWAFQKGYGHLNLDLITEEFVDFWRGASKNAVKRDWAATWRNRVRDVAAKQQHTQRNPNIPEGW